MNKIPANYLLTVVVLFFSFTLVGAQSENTNGMDQGYYVVVGAFKIQKNAIRFTEVLVQQGTTASYGYNPENDMHYVYTGKFLNLDTAAMEVSHIREDTAFHDAWVKAIGIQAEMTNEEQLVIKDAIEVADSIALTQSSESELIINDEITLENTEIFLSLFNATNNRVINGKVKVIDPKKNKLLAEVNGNEYLKLPASIKNAEDLILICEITGYRKIQLEINYQDPLKNKENPSIQLFGTTVLVNFDMVPYAKGDIVTLYNVYFYNDAAIMQPESQYELNQVVQMMKDNPTQRIRLHGHTNGNYTGKIISMGSEKNYFSLQDAENHFGTARELAEERASIIKEYLSDNDIDKNRIEIKAWGGKRPLFDKHSNRAKMNVRVEVEIL